MNKKKRRKIKKKIINIKKVLKDLMKILMKKNKGNGIKLQRVYLTYSVSIM